MITGVTIMDTTTNITMTIDPDGQALLRLMTWLSPAFPVGAFAYSGGLEAAVREGHVATADDLETWIAALMRHGALWNDAVLLAEAWRAFDDADRLSSAIELATALAGSHERHLEITAQGEAFVEAATAWDHPVLGALAGETPYAVAVGAVAAANGIALDRTLAAYLHALASQLVSAAIRLGVLGQRQGVRTLAILEAAILETATRAARSTLDDLGGASVIADIMSLRHEVQQVRLFRS